MRKSWIAVALVGVSGLVAAGVVVGRMTSDDETGKQLLIVPRPVERRDLDDVLTISGEVRREEIQEINLPVDGKVSSLAVGDGDTIDIGDPLFALDGRTAVAVAGDFAFYRTLDVGSDGPDVAQLENILVGAGYPISAVDSLFTEETRAALTRWQVDHGYGGATPEATETITVGLAQNQAGYSVGKANTVAFRIEPSAPGAAGSGVERAVHTRKGTEDKPEITLTSSFTDVEEGGQVNLTITAEPAPANNLTIDLTIDGDAVGGDDPEDGDDYQEFDDSIVMAAGQTTYTIPVPIFVDQVKEGREEIIVSLTDQYGNDPNYFVGSSNKVRIRIAENGDDLLPVITVKSSTGVVSEGGTVTFTFTTTIESNEDLDLIIALGGGAVNGDDYVAVEPDAVTILAGETTADLQIQIRKDGYVEPDEELLVAVAPAPEPTPYPDPDPDADLHQDPLLPAYVGGFPSQVSVIIESDDLPELTLRGGGAVAEGGTASFTIVADSPVSADTSINYQVGGTAQSGSDYETLTGTVVMRTGHSQVSVGIKTIDDDVVFLPSDMVVADWPARIGSVDVDEGEFVMQGSAVLTLTEPVFTITLAVSASDRAELEVGQAVMVSLDSADLDLPGVIATLDETATVNEAGEESYEGTVQVQGDVSAVDGARVTIDVTLAERLDVLAVPVASVLRSAGGDEVRVINDEGTITRVAVTIGLVDGEWVEITSGLVGDELVVVDVDAEADVEADGG